MKIVKKKIEDLHEAKVNSRYHTDRQIDEYIRSIKMFGQTKPIVADENGEVIIGNGLLKAFQKMGAKEADCYIVAGLDDRTKKKMMLADNKIFELGMSLDDVMTDIVREYKETDIPGFNEDILSALVASAEATTSAIEAYGEYPTETLSNINKNAAEGAIEPLYTNAPSFQTKNVQQTTDASSNPMVEVQISENQTQTPEGAVETERYVICPNCGQRIKI